MSDNHTAEEWSQLLEKVYMLITRDMEAVETDQLANAFPKFIVMYEFFRLLRGEAFSLSRPVGIGENQSRFYEMEDSLLKKLREFAKKLDPADDRLQYFLGVMKQSFDLQTYSPSSPDAQAQ